MSAAWSDGHGREHDDLLICAALDDASCGAGESFAIPAVDPLEEMGRAW